MRKSYVKYAIINRYQYMYSSHIDVSILHMIKFLFKCMSRALAVKNELIVGHRSPLQFPNVAKREQCELYEVLKDTGRVSMFSSQHSVFLWTTFSNRRGLGESLLG